MPGVWVRDFKTLEAEVAKLPTGVRWVNKFMGCYNIRLTDSKQTKIIRDLCYWTLGFVGFLFFYIFVGELFVPAFFTQPVEWVIVGFMGALGLMAWVLFFEETRAHRYEIAYWLPKPRRTL